MQTISSQRYLDNETVEAKRLARDYECSYVEVEVEGSTYRVLVDGHHSFEAARRDNARVVWSRNETLQQEARNGIAYLENHNMGDDWYDIETGVLIF